MHYEQYYQLATKEQYLASMDTQEEKDALEASLSSCRVLQQAPTLYNNMRCCGDFTTATGMIIRHLEFANGYMQMMWAKAATTQDFSMIPFKIDELNLILANEPSEEV